MKNPKSENANAKNIQKNIESLLRDSPKKGFKNSPSIYSIPLEKWDAMDDKDRKKFRRGMRNKLNHFKNDLLGKDRSMQDRKNAKKDFIKFFKDNYISSKLESSSIYQGNNEIIRKDYDDMIKMIEMI